MSNKRPPSELSQLVGYIREELEKADRARQVQGKAALFELATMELELQFAVEYDGTAKSGFRLFVVDVGLEGKFRNEQIQKVKLTYNVPASAKSVNLKGFSVEPGLLGVAAALP